MISCWQLFKTLFKINLITFGGGYTIAPVIKDEFCKKKKLIETSDMLDIMALAQSGPGALAVSTSLLTGYKILGKKGALIGAIASFTPPLFVISIVYLFYEKVYDNFWIRVALRGMSGVISAVLLLTTYDLAKEALKINKYFSLAVMLSSFVIGYFTSINVGFIILTLAILGIIVFSTGRMSPK
ncbi:MAG: chromate transporter [Anaerococcus sp.]|uniref:chromate transporter n=1 Tax=Anaerococcus sp. TaxID=1872515 RepID=UPI002608847F|nr:chromate transporter [Anaerococcus sp.]MCI5971517.1 chromate transporter [Anaerococcus sp.]MDD6919091.1 chromate transporter [Peptoniphilaceae bacterium]MDY2927451.1 chromate transporter [Anaerococcus sp.]